MRDPNVSPELRIKVAQVAAPFIHAKPETARSKEPTARPSMRANIMKV